MNSSDSKADGAGKMEQNPDEAAQGHAPFFQGDTETPISDSSSLPTDPSSFTPPSRSGTLVWQQRPSSKTRTVMPTESKKPNPPKSKLDAASASDVEVSRSQITQSLGSKDPKWFRQTPDRGLGSLAYMKADNDNAMSILSPRENTRLPGMSRESTVEPEKESSPRTQSVRSNSPSRENSLRGSKALSQRFSASAIASPMPLGSPLPTLDSHRLEPPTSEMAASSSQEKESTSSRGIAMSPSQGRLFQDRGDRPPSPTKGLGGFVQSAMLKRSESVSKRRSVQAGLGLSRGNSIASNRSGHDGSRAVMNIINSRESKIASRETSPILISRLGPGMATSTASEIRETNEAQVSANEVAACVAESHDDFIKPALPNNSRLSPKDINSQSFPLEFPTKSPPKTPNQSVDTNKQAPSKASWLQTALNRSDSPMQKAVQPSQPSWMVEVNRAKQLRGGVDHERSATSKELATEGIIQPSSIGSDIKYSSLIDRTGTHSPQATSQDRARSGDIPLEKQSLSSSVKKEDEIDHIGTTTKFSKANTAGKELGSAETDTASKMASVPSPIAESIKKSIATKTKPLTPPKKDFRSNLKSRQIPGDKKQEEEPEFKNVFGKLKRTQTQNYVAPDELKDNIKRGKAGLVVTGGPKKTERRDELKESISRKKEEIKTGGPTNLSGKISDRGDANIPENTASDIIARKIGLGGLENALETSPSPTSTDLKVPETKSMKKVEIEKPIYIREKQSTVPGRMQTEPTKSGKLADRYNPNLAGMLSRGLSPLSGGAGYLNVVETPKSANYPNDRSILASRQASDEKLASTQLSHATKGRARGPKRRLPTSVKLESSLESKGVDREHDLQENVVVTTETHLTASTPKGELLRTGIIARPMSSNSIENNQESLFTPLIKPVTPTKKAVLDKFKSLPPQSPSLLSQSSTPTKTSSLSPNQMPKSSPASPHVRKPSTKIIHSPQAITIPTSQSEINVSPQPIEVEVASAAMAMQPISVSLPLKSEKSTPQEKVSSNLRSQLSVSQSFQRHPPEKTENVLTSGADRDGPPYDSGSPRPQKPNPPIKTSTRKDKDAAIQAAGFGEQIAKDLVGLGIRSSPGDLNTPNTHHLGLQSPMQSPTETSRPLPLPPKKPQSIAGRVVSSNAPSLTQLPKESSSPEVVQTYRLITEIFGKTPISKTKVNIETHKVLSSRVSSNDSDKIKTLRKQIWQISGDGKKMDIASDQEHILYDENMYLCTHVFGAGALGTRTTETYFWHGDEVPSSAIEDAQLFARKAAKDNNGKLIILPQGKETSNFFHALGGIVITRHGYSGTYMLCGRRHVGQIAFDEVPFTVGSLCSGFPYIISAPFGKLYLWKGKGSGADELGCARLIGMDLGLTGEIEEVEEGNEPEDFWKAFPDRTKPASPIGDNYWHLKPSCDNFDTHLFFVEVEAPPPKSSSGLTFGWARRGSAVSENCVAKITEIHPFTQSDLKVMGVFVLDTFFEIFMYVAAISILVSLRLPLT